MINQGLMGKTGSRMGHMNIDGPEGSMKAFEKLSVKRKIYIHLNNSNPVLNEFSKEYAIVTAAGWEVAEDGLEIKL
jgi:pyrroloquinoline quinone biosynthesis protein B